MPKNESLVSKKSYFHFKVPKGMFGYLGSHDAYHTSTRICIRNSEVSILTYPLNLHYLEQVT